LGEDFDFLFEGIAGRDWWFRIDGGVVKVVGYPEIGGNG
jgi:hypothetical protein